MYVRISLWTPAMAYVGGLLTVGNGLSSPGVMFTAAFLGALSGLVLAMMFTLRQQRRNSQTGRYWRTG